MNEANVSPFAMASLEEEEMYLHILQILTGIL